MRKLFGILTFCSVLLAHSSTDELPECGEEETRKLRTECAVLVLEFQEIESKYKADKSQDLFAEMAEICDQIKACLASLKCKRAANGMKIMGNTCSDLNYSTNDNRKCAEEFFKDAVLARYTNVSSCLKEYGFLEDNLVRRKRAYIQGKVCFLNHVKKVCTTSAYEHFATVYDDFVEHVSTTPVVQFDMECDGAFHDFNALRCLAITIETNDRIQDIAKFDLNPDDPVVPVIQRMCRDVKKCLDDPCAADANPLGPKLMELCQMMEDALREEHGEL